MKWFKESLHCLSHLFMLNDAVVITRYDKITGKLRLSSYCKTCGRSHEILDRKTRRFGAANRRVD